MAMLLNPVRNAHLVQERLEHVLCLGHRDDAGGARVVDAVVEVVHAARVHDFLPAAMHGACIITRAWHRGETDNCAGSHVLHTSRMSAARGMNPKRATNMCAS